MNVTIQTKRRPLRTTLGEHNLLVVRLNFRRSLRLMRLGTTCSRSEVEKEREIRVAEVLSRTELGQQECCNVCVFGTDVRKTLSASVKETRYVSCMFLASERLGSWMILPRENYTVELHIEYYIAIVHRSILLPITISVMVVRVVLGTRFPFSSSTDVSRRDQVIAFFAALVCATLCRCAGAGRGCRQLCS